MEENIISYRLQLISGISDDGVDIPCETFKRELIRRIKGLDVDIYSQLESQKARDVDEAQEEDVNVDVIHAGEIEYQNHRQTEHNSYIESFVNKESRFSDVIMNIKEQATFEAMTDGDRDNLMYNPHFAKYFTELSKTLLIWSAVNCQFFELSNDTASTANCESYFKDCKLTHKDVIPCRVDTFITEDIKAIDGCVIEASQKYIKYIGGRNIMEENITQNVESESEEASTTTDTSTLQKKLYDLYHLPQNLESDHFSNNVSAGKSTDENVSVDHELPHCIACTNKHFPSEAHSCYKCGKNVHLLPGCSKSIHDEEGYGERRICISCSVQTNKLPLPDNFSSDLANELNNREKWNKKKKKTKQSSYLKTAPNWDLIISVDKKLKLGMLSNGNLSKITYNVNGKAVALRNTCAFDATAQVRFSTLLFKILSLNN